VGVADDLFPRGAGARDAELARDSGGRLGTTIADGNDLDAGEGAQTGDVTAAGVGARADEANTESTRRSGHRRKPRRTRADQSQVPLDRDLLPSPERSFR